MRKKIEWKWEKIDENTLRAQVIGGWILHHTGVSQKGGGVSESMVFLPDREHEWIIIPPSNEIKYL